jgi:spermidine/putrescine transport system ATP-binding protein
LDRLPPAAPIPAANGAVAPAPAGGAPLLRLEGVQRCFGALRAVDGVDLEIHAGEFFTLLGPSGCGKTTLLRLIAGFERPDAGRILLGGVDLAGTAPERRPVHTVFQSYALFPHMTVAENLAFPLRMAGVRPEERRERVAALLSQVRLREFADRYPSQLSGGQRQRVAVARALAGRPRLLLLDEPLAALDLKLREQMQRELISLQTEVGITFVYVTHDQGEALALSDRVAVMNGGRIEQVGDPADVYEFPRSRFVADFIGTCNLLDGTISDHDRGLLRLQVPAAGTVAVAWQGASTPGPATLAVRPEKVRIDAAIAPDPDENRLEGIVREQLYLGDVTVYRVLVADALTIEAMLPNTAARGGRFFEVGDRVQVAWRHDAGRFLAS